jgi:two-component system, chemotaxis family, chemotaxis protein CheY
MIKIITKKRSRSLMAKIMIVDDAAFMRAMIRDMLTKSGHEIVAEAKNGLEAVQMYPSAKPDLMTMDITMPEMDGVTALRNIRSLDPAARVIMCSAMGQHAMVLDAIQAGAKDFVVKPLQQQRLLDAIEKVLS